MHGLDARRLIEESVDEGNPSTDDVRYTPFHVIAHQKSFEFNGSISHITKQAKLQQEGDSKLDATPEGPTAGQYGSDQQCQRK